MSGSAADIAQRVSEWEEELAVSPEGIMHSDESGADPVSYTHLDVYKRQELNRAINDAESVLVTTRRRRRPLGVML